MRILIYGAGVLGSYLAHALLRGGNDVTLPARGDWKKTIDQAGLVIRHWAQTKTTVDRIKTIDNLAEGAALKTLTAQATEPNPNTPGGHTAGRICKISSGARGRERNLEAQFFQILNVSGLNFTRVQHHIVIDAQILKWLLEFQHMVDGNQHGMRNRNDGFFITPPGCELMISCIKEAVLTSYRTYGALHNGLLKMHIPFTDIRTLSLSGAFIASRNDTGPRAKCFRIPKLLQRMACFGDDPFRASTCDPGNRI